MELGLGRREMDTNRATKAAVVWCVCEVAVILLGGVRRALDETGKRYGTDSINETWFQIGSLGKTRKKKEAESEK